MLEQDNIKKLQIDENVRKIKFGVSNNNNEKYKVKTIKNSAVYIKELELNYLPKFYYLVY